jgi:hypothetical protein
MFKFLWKGTVALVLTDGQRKIICCRDTRTQKKQRHVYYQLP